MIGWTNGLSRADQEAVEEEFNEVFQDGYYQLAMVENPELEVPFALSAWGALQTCDEVDTAAIRPFVEEWYASPKSAESGARLPGPRRAGCRPADARSAAGRGTRARASSSRPGLRAALERVHALALRATPPSPWRGVTISGSAVQPPASRVVALDLLDRRAAVELLAAEDDEPRRRPTTAAWPLRAVASRRQRAPAVAPRVVALDRRLAAVVGPGTAAGDDHVALDHAPRRRGCARSASSGPAASGRASTS